MLFARRCLLLLFVASLAGGCVSRQPAPPPAEPVAAALTFRPLHGFVDQAEFDAIDALLARADRGPAVVLGYDTPIFESYYLEIDDRQRVLGGIGGYGFRGLGFFGGGGLSSGRVYDTYDRREVTVRSFDRVRPTP
jgi:hypothetical protein